MEQVSGIGGFFFRSRDPAALALWYEEHLGITPAPKTYGATSWSQEKGNTVFAPFSEKSGYFGNPDKVWMINFRVHSLDAMVKQLTSAGVEVSVDTHDYPNGRFARLHDPEGNPIELWEPKASE
jgi:predicted enzyme related to lactoylglutathione lyase